MEWSRNKGGTHQNHPSVRKPLKDIVQECHKPVGRIVDIEALSEVIGTDHEKNIVPSTVVGWKLDDVVDFAGDLIDSIPSMACEFPLPQSPPPPPEDRISFASDE